MFFEVIFETKPLHLAPEEKVAFTTSKSGKDIHVLMECIKGDELKKGQTPGSVRCSARTEFALTKEEEKELERPKIEGDKAVGETFEKTEAELRRIVERAVYIYRWRRGPGDIHDPIVYRFGMSWSRDGKIWSPTHGASKVFLTGKFGLPYSQILAGFIESLKDVVESDANEPLGHELFHEAWVLRESNPRGSLVIGLAALEAGFKEMVADLLPGSGWLVENAPTAPMTKMLKRFMPTLKSRAVINGVVPEVSPKVLKTLNDWIEFRNEIAHGVRRSIDVNGLDDLLRTVRALLFLFDVYRGQLWAAGMIPPDILKPAPKN